MPIAMPRPASVGRERDIPDEQEAVELSALYDQEPAQEVLARALEI